MGVVGGKRVGQQLPAISDVAPRSSFLTAREKPGGANDSAASANGKYFEDLLQVFIEDETNKAILCRSGPISRHNEDTIGQPPTTAGRDVDLSRSTRLRPESDAIRWAVCRIAIKRRVCRLQRELF